MPIVPPASWFSLLSILPLAAAQEPVVQVHDLTSITAPLPGFVGRLDRPQMGLPIGPVLDWHAETASDGGRVALLPVMVPRLGHKELSDWLERLWSGEQGAAALDGQQLRLRAPNEVQATVRDVLALLAAIRQQSHRVTLFELPPGAGAGQRAVLEPKQVDALLEASPPRRATAATVPVDVPWLWESGRSISYVRDFDVEVAEKAGISDPKLDTFFAGTRLGLCLTPLIDGRVLARAALQATAAPAALPERKLAARGLGTLHLPQVATTELSATAALQPGGGILLSGDRDATVWLLRVEPTMPQPLQVGTAAALPLGGLSFAKALAARHLDLVHQVGEDGSRSERAAAEPPDALAALDALVGGGLAADRRATQTFGSHVVLVGPSERRARIEQELQKQAATLRTASIAFKVGRVGTDLALKHLAGRATANELADALPAGGAVATLFEHPFAVTVGSEQAYVRDFEVEIAAKAAAANPVVDVAFRGFQLTGVVHATAGGAPQIAVRLQWADHADLPAVDLANTDLGAVDVPVITWTDVEPRLPVRTGEWMPLHIEPGLDPASGSLVVLVRVD